MIELVFLLLPVAACSGWFMGRRSQSLGSDTDYHPLSRDYYAGLNYLLNEQPDKAVDAFIRMLDSSPDTVETTLALGNFFRRRGEVDRAIRIHQSLIAKPNLTPKQRSSSLLELGQDYMRAGVYDRAESLFLDLTNSVGEQLILSLRHLIDIYERERDWEKAIQIASRLQATTGQFMGQEIAHYYCELAHSLYDRGKIRMATRQLKIALSYDKSCVRASVLQGEIEYAQGRYKSALKAFKRIQHQDPAFVPEVLDEIRRCYKAMGLETHMLSFLNHLIRTCPNISVIIAHAEGIKSQVDASEAVKFLAEHMRHYPSIRGIKHLVDLHVSQNSENTEALSVIRSLIEKLVKNKPIYRCGVCGFAGKSLHWQCPSCRQWSSVKPIQGIEGE